MVFVYKIVNSVNGKEYIGITKNTKLRWNAHVHSSKTKNTPLYSAMRKYGIDKFNMQVICICPNWGYACAVEVALIFISSSLYNLAAGGEGGFVVPEASKSEWKKKLSNARKGAKPALGMKHTEQNKALFADLSRKYWETQDTYDAEAVTKHSFKEAKKLFGISKTHYYRLKRGMSNDHV
jgi:group I intron endonuclease